MAKKIQSNICGMLKSFRSAASAIYGCHTPKLRAHVHVCFTRAGRRARGRLAAKMWRSVASTPPHPPLV